MAMEFPSVEPQLIQAKQLIKMLCLKKLGCQSYQTFSQAFLPLTLEKELEYGWGEDL
jgi:hypothetical protein